MLRAKTVVPRVERRRPTAPQPVPAAPPTVPTPLALDEMPAGRSPSPVSRAAARAVRHCWAPAPTQVPRYGVLTVVLLDACLPSAVAAERAGARLRQRPGFHRSILRQVTAGH